MDLYKKYKKSSTKQRSVSRGGLLTIVSISLIALMIATGIRFAIERMLIKSDITNIQAYVDNPANLKKYEESKLINDDTRQLNGFKENLDELNDIFTKKETIGSNVMREIYAAKPSNVIITNMTVNGPMVSLTYSSTKEDDSSSFIKGLKERSIIKEVNYNGYTLNESDNVYTGTATLLLRGNF